MIIRWTWCFLIFFKSFILISEEVCSVLYLVLEIFEMYKLLCYLVLGLNAFLKLEYNEIALFFI